MVFLGYLFYLNKLLDASNWVVRVVDTIIFLFGIIFILSFDILTEHPVAVWFTIILFIHTFIYFYLPRYSSQGQMLKNQINQYRSFLISSEGNQDAETIQAYLFALDLPSYRSEQLDPLLSLRPMRKHRFGDSLLYW